MRAMSNDFLRRWSRRKLEAGEPLPADPVEAIDELEAASALDPPVDGAEILQAPGEMTQAEIDALPDAEALTPTSDIRVFLRSGVPAALRNRALRRMWSIDPEIRDYIGDARDYAWDWNTPGGVPVSGPLAASTDIRKMVRDIFGSDEPADPNAPPEPVAKEARALVAQPVAEPDEPAATIRIGAVAQTADEALDAQVEAASVAPQAPRVRSGRHGGALPS